MMLTVMPFKPNSLARWTLAIAAAVAVHLLLLGILGVTRLVTTLHALTDRPAVADQATTSLSGDQRHLSARPLPPDQPLELAGSAPHKAQNPRRPTPSKASVAIAADIPIRPTTAQIADLVAAESTRVSSLTPEAQLAEIARSTAQLDRIAPASIQAISQIIEESAGLPNHRAYEPRPGVAGDFEHGTATLYDIRAAGSQGPLTYEWTMVDHAGRTIVLQIPASDMSPHDLAVAGLFTLARENPNLRMLLDTARRLATQQMDATSEPVASTTQGAAKTTSPSSVR